MKLIRTVFVFVFVFSYVCDAQGLKTKHVKTKKTPEHVNVAGTNLFLKIPEGFERSMTCIGWNTKEGSSVVVSKKQKNLIEVSAEVDQQLLGLGYDIISQPKKYLQINGTDAVYFEAKKGAVEKIFLVVKFNNFSYIIEGNFNSAKNEKKIIKKVLFSAFIEN